MASGGRALGGRSRRSRSPYHYLSTAVIDVPKYWPSNWIGTDIDLGKEYTAERADYVEAKYAQLVLNGNIEKYSGYPAVGNHVIVPDDDDHIWSLTVAAVKRFRYISDDDEKNGAEDDIDPLVWQCRERDGTFSSVEIKRLSKITAAHRASLTAEERQRIISRSYKGRSTVVLPKVEVHSNAGNENTEKSKKGVETAVEDNKERESGSASRARAVSKRKAEEEDEEQDHTSRAKRARTTHSNKDCAGSSAVAGAGSHGARITPPAGRISAASETNSSRHLPTLDTSTAPSNEAETNGEDGEGLVSMEASTDKKSFTFKTSRAASKMQHFQTDEDAVAAKTMEEMRSTAPRTWRAMMGIEEGETEYFDTTIHTTQAMASEKHFSVREGTSKKREAGQPALAATSAMLANAADTTGTRKSSRQTSRPRSYDMHQ
ncbi:hypothetical protein PRZ48_004914 [Zasmidium cellare]|uniref:Uncharacterized protein n=1 Tax=Zasmidium cellare TaxID=395010 RepID=A0ABR0ERK7_ZASCE|nr:hypothetical protein PRZ48_004914 [Zasmidium cellare]